MYKNLENDFLHRFVTNIIIKYAKINNLDDKICKILKIR